MSIKIGDLTILLPLLLGSLASCNPLTVPLKNPSVIPINQLQQQESDSTFYLEGKVGTRAPFLGSGAYQLQDNTGTVWVLTEGNLPTEGYQILIKGRVEYQSIPIQGQELGEFYVIELEQVESQASSPIQPTQPNQDLFLPHKRL